jgi:hypothetical protein
LHDLEGFRQTLRTTLEEFFPTRREYEMLQKEFDRVRVIVERRRNDRGDLET